MIRRRRLILKTCALLFGAAGGWYVAAFFQDARLAHSAPPPATAPSGADPTVDWLMNQSSPSTSQPATSTTAPAVPLQRSGATIEERPGKITLSDGRVFTGPISTTPGKPIRIWDEQAKEYRDIPLRAIKSAEAVVLWERDEAEWRFKTGGSDVKEYSGKTYPARETQYTFTFTNGETLTGGVVAPLYVDLPDGSQQTLVLHKRDKGDVGQTLAKLVYVRKVEFDAGKP